MCLYSLMTLILPGLAFLSYTPFLLVFLQRLYISLFRAILMHFYKASRNFTLRFCFLLQQRNPDLLNNCLSPLKMIFRGVRVTSFSINLLNIMNVVSLGSCFSISAFNYSTILSSFLSILIFNFSTMQEQVCVQSRFPVS